MVFRPSPAARSALLATLAAGLGDGFTPDVRQAWTDCYLLLAGAMEEAA